MAALEARSYFRTRFREDSRRERVWIHLTKYLARYVPEPERASVLELGAGYCYFINRVPAARRVAVDSSSDMRHRAAPGVEAHVADIVSFLRGASAEEFDFILASNLLEHFEWPVLEELIGLTIRAMKVGGRLALIQPNFRLVPGRYFDDYTHRTIFTDVSLRDWLESVGLEVIEVVPRFMPLTVRSRLAGFSFLIPLYLRLPWRPFAGQMLAVARRPEGWDASSAAGRAWPE